MNITEKVSKELDYLNRRIARLQEEIERDARSLVAFDEKKGSNSIVYYITTFLPNDVKKVQERAVELKHMHDKKDMLEYFLREDSEA